MQKSNVPLECTSMVKFKPDMVYNVYRIFPDIYICIYIYTLYTIHWWHRIFPFMLGWCTSFGYPASFWHLFLWAMASSAMLNNHRVYIYILYIMWYIMANTVFLFAQDACFSLKPCFVFFDASFWGQSDTCWFNFQLRWVWIHVWSNWMCHCLCSRGCILHS